MTSQGSREGKTLNADDKGGSRTRTARTSADVHKEGSRARGERIKNLVEMVWPGILRRGQARRRLTKWAEIASILGFLIGVVPFLLKSRSEPKSPSTNSPITISHGDNNAVFYGGNNTLNSITVPTGPSATAGPAPETYVFVSERAARIDLDFALNTEGSVGKARAILKEFPHSSAREEECQRVLQFAIKHSERKDADAVAHECFQGQELFQALEDVSTIHTSEQ